MASSSILLSTACLFVLICIIQGLNGDQGAAPTPAPAPAPAPAVPAAQTPSAAPVSTPVGAPPAHFPPPMNCTKACGVRCSEAGRPNVCQRACMTCCGRCQCVPPGTSGNQQACGVCWTGQITHGGKTKCP